MRSRRISKRVLASPRGIVMLGVELPSSDDDTYLLWRDRQYSDLTIRGRGDRSTDLTRFSRPGVTSLMVTLATWYSDLSIRAVSAIILQVTRTPRQGERSST
ncbi:hypothetical protein AVEN_244475-1 [Araneus ventricosus]|uniref:Uncharacterized protein n=1 Tax=Araneus ventricosus TaxID=182803 RepID=A0A4Y2S026_ARAVE|nr:hypothetical protein AVEN_244475-1 [Araneus ventricosus]